MYHTLICIAYAHARSRAHTHTHSTTHPYPGAHESVGVCLKKNCLLFMKKKQKSVHILRADAYNILIKCQLICYLNGLHWLRAKMRYEYVRIQQDMEINPIEISVKISN